MFKTSPLAVPPVFFPHQSCYGTKVLWLCHGTELRVEARRLRAGWVLMWLGQNLSLPKSKLFQSLHGFFQTSYPHTTNGTAIYAYIDPQNHSN